MNKPVPATLAYACREGAADCQQIQPGAPYYNPNTLESHASYAFNSYIIKRTAARLEPVTSRESLMLLLILQVSSLSSVVSGLPHYQMLYFMILILCIFILWLQSMVIAKS